LLTSISIPIVEAHVLVYDRDIGAVMHIDPDDAPVAKEQSAFFFEFKDTQNKFDPVNCDCTFSISENGTEIYSQPLFQNSTKPTLNNAGVFYTFSKKDVYEIKIVGKPNSQNAFQSFTLVYNVRVDQIATPATTSENTNFFTRHRAGFIGVGIGFFICIIIMFFDKLVKGGEKNDGKKANNNKY
jgi:hypothetical protein